MKKAFALLLSLLMLSTLLLIPVCANSAQTHWSGVDSTGALVVGEDCPIEVTSELLTLYISEFPESYYNDSESFLAYTGRVTAEYTLYNPSDYTVTAKLLFPFGEQPSYAPYMYDGETDSYLTADDTDKYDITLNGESIAKVVRYSVNADVATSLPSISDDYITDEFFVPEMTVTTYTYMVGGADKEGQIDDVTFRSAVAAFEWDGGDGRSRIYIPGSTAYRAHNGGDPRIGCWVKNGDVLTVTVFGEPLEEPVEWKCYENGTDSAAVIDGSVALINTETATLEDFALSEWKESTGVKPIDWYNAVIACLRVTMGKDLDNTVQPFAITTERFASDLIRWYEYEITIAPGESVVNSVTAPLYPEINMSYDPDLYSYTYLLSPALTWKSFGKLDIVINTPYYITESSLDEFTRTESGYTMSLDGLPDKELQLSLCTDENPTSAKDRVSTIEILFIAAVIAILLIGLTIIAVAIVAIVFLTRLLIRAIKRNRF